MNQVVYMLSEDDGSCYSGPFRGAVDLDFVALANQFRTERYASSEAAGEDYCFITTSDFIEWLTAHGHLLPVRHRVATVRLDTGGEHAYEPGHWPVCPACSEGRGVETLGRVFRDLNRCELSRECSRCKFQWDHRHGPYNESEPMLEDDGRYTPSGCVPYAISQALGLPFDLVLDTCARHGWSEGHGMDEHRAVVAAAELGGSLISEPVPLSSFSRPTLRRVLGQLDAGEAYILATRDHWLAVVNGAIKDAASTDVRACVVGMWRVDREAKRAVSRRRKEALA